MYSKSFMKFLFGNNETKKEDNSSVKEIEFSPVKVREAAKVVITAIKNCY